MVPSGDPADTPLLDDVHCQQCGYNLRGLAAGGRCPECDTAVGRSRYGDLLSSADPVWVGGLASGANWLAASIVVGVAVLAWMVGLTAFRPGP